MSRFAALIPVEPLPKGRPRFGQGRVYTPKGTEEYENTVRWLLRAQVTKQHMIIPALTGRIGVHLVFWVADERSDLDNYVKAVWDAGNKILWKDDRQIKHSMADIYKITAGIQPHFEIAAWEIDAGEEPVTVLP